MMTSTWSIGTPARSSIQYTHRTSFLFSLLTQRRYGTTSYRSHPQLSRKLEATQGLLQYSTIATQDSLGRQLARLEHHQHLKVMVPYQVFSNQVQGCPSGVQYLLLYQIDATAWSPYHRSGSRMLSFADVHSGLRARVLHTNQFNSLKANSWNSAGENRM